MKWLTNAGEYIVTGDGEYIALAGADIPVILPEIIRVRRSIGDPRAADFVIAASLPVTAPPDEACTTGNGRYFCYDGVEWRPYTLKFSDAYIGTLLRERGRIRACIRLVDDLLARIDPADWLTSGTAGGQSVSFPTLAEAVEYYRTLRARLMEEAAADAGMNSGLMLQTARRPVGGVLEDYE